MDRVAYSLRLIEDRLAPGAVYADSLPALNRVIYVAAGQLAMALGSESVRLSSDTARRGSGTPAVRAGAEGAHVLRFELCAQPPPSPGGGRVILEHPIAVDARTRSLMRCDRVDFEPGGVALPHRHRGGGIRRLLWGRLEVTVGDAPARVMRPGDAWFESGHEPVRAVSAADEATSFVRVSVLPAEFRGRSSIMYVDPADAERSRPRTYTVYVDEPITLGSEGVWRTTRAQRVPPRREAASIDRRGRTS